VISSKEFLNNLINNGFNFFTGVPDSLLKELNCEIFNCIPAADHIIAANEGSAIGIAAGYYLANKIPAVVYLQNSGIGNCINPLLSLADEEIYSIPMLLLIGWRGKPGLKDEPQHLKQGRVMEKLLNSIDMKYFILNKNSDYSVIIKSATEWSTLHSRPVTILIEPETFAKSSRASLMGEQEFALKREDAIRIVARHFQDDPIISTTGMISRELYDYRCETGVEKRDFLTVGSMGHASSIALGLALQKKSKRIILLDGDGAFLMHMGAAATIGALKPGNLIHIVLNNGAHDSVGGQPTIARSLDLSAVARSLGYVATYDVQDQEGLEHALSRAETNKTLTFLNINVSKGARPNLPRPTETPKEIKRSFMTFINDRV
jgi:phosphonopyruvate decarboxylase